MWRDCGYLDSVGVNWMALRGGGGVLSGARSSESHPDPPYLCTEGPGGTRHLTKPQGLCGTGSQAGGITECLQARQALSRGVVLASRTVASRSLPALAEKELSSRLLSVNVELLIPTAQPSPATTRLSPRAERREQGAEQLPGWPTVPDFQGQNFSW